MMMRNGGGDGDGDDGDDGFGDIDHDGDGNGDGGDGGGDDVTSYPVTSSGHLVDQQQHTVLVGCAIPCKEQRFMTARAHSQASTARFSAPGFKKSSKELIFGRSMKVLPTSGVRMHDYIDGSHRTELPGAGESGLVEREAMLEEVKAMVTEMRGGIEKTLREGLAKVNAMPSHIGLRCLFIIGWILAGLSGGCDGAVGMCCLGVFALFSPCAAARAILAALAGRLGPQA
eukprot:3793753-Rhodomonas_salina.1